METKGTKVTHDRTGRQSIVFDVEMPPMGEALMQCMIIVNENNLQEEKLGLSLGLICPRSVIPTLRRLKYKDLFSYMISHVRKDSLS